VAFDLAAVLIELLINIIFWVITVVPALWLSGRFLAGKEHAKFTDALWIVVLGTIIFYFVGYTIESFFTGLTGTIWISYLVLLIVWLALVKHFFDCGWLKALVISIIAVIIAIVIWVIIGLILVLIGVGGWFPDPTTITF
jgi:hypothetical protein